MNVIIAGGGIAGLSAAAVLRKLPFIKSIKIYEPTALLQMNKRAATRNGDINDVANKSSPSVSTANHYNGMWSPALQCLQSLGIYSKIESQLHAVRKSGYKNVAGHWLAFPTIGLQEPPGTPSLAFIDNDFLLSALIESVSEHDPTRCCPVDICWGVGVTGVARSRGSQSVTVTDSKNEAYKADLLIAADGTFSQVFKSLYPLSDNKPVYRGYKVYRGYSEVSSHSKDIGQDRGNASEGTTINSEPPQLSSRYCDYGFQTWGPSLRFACVPTVSGNAWYIAVASKEKVTTSNSSEAGNKASASQHSFTGPFSNSSVTVGDEEFDSLKAVLNKWHSPIREILGGTLRTREPNTSEQGTGVRVSDSYAFKCRETLDPILAQGAGVAVEDSHVLGSLLERHYRHRSYDSFTINSHDRGGGNDHSMDSMQHTFQTDGHTVDIKGVLLDFDKARSGRISRLELFSELSQLLGQVQSPFLNRVRDFFILLVPQTLKGALFDLSIRAISAFDISVSKK